jgi:hypothetical protein
MSTAPTAAAEAAAVEAVWCWRDLVITYSGNAGDDTING